MDKALIDTDILSEIMRGRNSRVLEHAATNSAESRAFTVSVVTVAEIVKGLRKVSRAPALERFIAELPQFEVLPIDTQVAILAGNMYAELERSGQPIGRAGESSLNRPRAVSKRRQM